MENTKKDLPDEVPDKLLFCNICNLSIPNKASMDQHLLGQKHVRLYNAKEEQRRVEQKCGIYVRGYPSHLTESQILSYFSKYGTVVWKHFGPTYLLLDFSEPSPVEKLMKQINKLEGSYLTIKYRELREQRQKPTSSYVEDKTEILEILKTTKLLSHQVLALIDYLQSGVSGDSVGLKCYTVCKDLLRILKYSFPRCQTFPFGSSLTGLYFLNSDVDIYISGVRPDHEDDIGYLYRIKSRLSQSQCFSNIIVIGHAKIPILKCIHIPTNTNCDINIRNMLGVCNSQLLLYYIQIDPKIKHLMMIIKYWAKTIKISGCGSLFTNYSLCLMVIFFLQGAPYHLPSVRFLQSDPQFNRIHEGWNGGFKQMMSLCPHIHKSSLLSMLENFFFYYADFDYSSLVICPYLGIPVEKKTFKSPESLPHYFKAYKNYISVPTSLPLKVDGFVCVQDPFELSRNTTPIVSDSSLNLFVRFCRHAKVLCQEGENAFLFKLLTQSPPNFEVELLSQASFTQFGISMGRHMKYLKAKLNGSVSEKLSALKELWFKSVIEFTLIVLKEFLNLTVEECGGPTDSKRSKANNQVDVHALQIASFKCYGKLNLWNSRKVINDQLSNDTKTLVEKESEVTKSLLKLYKDIPQESNIIEFNITLEKKYEPAQVIFNLSKISAYKKTFRGFGEFLSKKFGIWFELYEKDMNNSL